MKIKIDIISSFQLPEPYETSTQGMENKMQRSLHS